MRVGWNVRSYHKVNMRSDLLMCSDGAIGDGDPNWYAIQYNKTRLGAIQNYNVMTGYFHGGTTWFLVNGPTVFDPVVLSLTGLQMVNSLWFPIPYANHPLN
jgi:hypothetical protein